MISGPFQPDVAENIRNSMTENVSFRQLLEDVIAGQEDAATRIVEEHTDALIRVARQRIGGKLGQRIDAEDVLQSVYRSFFGRLQDGQYDISTGRDLWNLLVRMMLNKICRQAQHHQTQKRDMRQEEVVGQKSSQVPFADLVRVDEPDPQDAAVLIEEVEGLLARLAEQDRPIVELRLQGYTTSEISKETGRPERSVRRVIERLKASLENAAVTAD